MTNWFGPKLWALHVKVFENESYPVVEHIFRGKTKKEAEGYFRSHMKTDSFLRDCVNKGEFNGIDCRYTAQWNQ